MSHLRPLLARACFLLALATLGLLARNSEASGNEPLHERIDRIVESSAVGGTAPVASDEEFIRRVYLDLAGMTPPVGEVRAFLADASSDKRARLIDRLLASPDFARRMSIAFDVMLMERRGDKVVPTAEWRTWLYDSFLANKPFNQLAGEILAADGLDPAKRPAARYYLDRDAEPHLVTRDVGRMFFGMDLQCAQCHDHPLIEDYYQADYHGLFAYLSRISLFTDKDKKVLLAEKGEGEAAFQSVFDPNSKGVTRPRLPQGRQIDEPFFPAGEEYNVKPDKEVRPVPKFSRLAQLASAVAAGDNPAFRRNIANRLWALMLGRGIVHPLDLHNGGNPPSHPELLDLLATEFAAMNFDTRAMIREIALSRTYQRSLAMPAELSSLAASAAANINTLEQQDQQLATAAGLARDAAAPAIAQVAEAEKADAAASGEAAKVSGLAASARAAAEAAQAAVQDTQAKAATGKQVTELLASAGEKLQQAAAVSGDQEIAASAAGFLAQSQKRSEALAALQQAAAEKEQAAKAAADASQAAQAAAAPVVETAANVRRTLAEADARSAPLAADWRAKANASAVATGQLRQARLLAAFSQAELAAKTAQQELELKQNELAQLRSALAVVETAIAQNQVAADAASQQAAEARSAEKQKLLEQAAAAESQLAPLAEKAASAQAALEAQSSELCDDWSKRFAVSPLAPLGPEQLAWSMMQALGIVERERAALQAEWEKNNPLPADAPASAASDPARLAARDAHVEKACYEKLQGNAAVFVGLFAGAAGQPQDEFFATVDQALFLANGGHVRGWLAPGGGNLTERLINLAEPQAFAEELYLSLFSRRPTADEVQQAAAYLAPRSADRSAAVQEVVWALLTSVEFRFSS